MKKHIVVVLLLLTVLCARPNEIFAACDAKLTLDLEKQSRDYFTNGQVSVLQTFLKDQGFFQSDVTGFFGNDTYAAVQGYQSARSINPVSGFVGALTRASINSELCMPKNVSIINQIIAGASIETDNQPAVLGLYVSEDQPASAFNVIAPNGGERFKAGKKVKIALDMDREFFDYNKYRVDVQLVPASGNNRSSVLIASDPSKDRFSWKIPKDTYTGDYVINIQVWHRVNPCGPNADTSECYMSIDTSDTSFFINGVTPPVSTGLFNVDLTLGSVGTDVVALQNMLIAQGYLVIPPGATKGYFGVQTQTAVARWQAANGIYPADGYFGPTSRARANQVFCYGNNCGGEDVQVQVNVPTEGSIYGSEDDVQISWTSFGNQFDYYNIHVGLYSERDTLLLEQKIPKSRTSSSIGSERLLGALGDFFSTLDYTYSDKYGADILKNVYVRVDAVQGIPNGETIIAQGKSGLFNLVVNNDDKPLIVSDIEVDDLERTYQVGVPVIYKIEGKLANVSRGMSNSVTPSQGFGARAAIEEYDAVGKQWFTRSNLINTADMYATGVWDGKSRWDIKMKAPLDATKTYRVRSIVYCANRALGCISGEGAVAVHTQAITVTANGGPTEPPATLSEADVINSIKNDARKIKSALASYYADNGVYPPAEMPLSTLVSSKYLGKYLSSTPKFSVEGITSFSVNSSDAVYYYGRSENGLQCGKGGTNTSFVAESTDLPYILLFSATPDSAEKGYYGPAKYFNRAWFSGRDTYPAHWSYCL